MVGRDFCNRSYGYDLSSYENAFFLVDSGFRGFYGTVDDPAATTGKHFARLIDCISC